MILQLRIIQNYFKFFIDPQIHKVCSRTGAILELFSKLAPFNSQENHLHIDGGPQHYNGDQRALYHELFCSLHMSQFGNGNNNIL